MKSLLSTLSVALTLAAALPAPARAQTALWDNTSPLDPTSTTVAGEPIPVGHFHNSNPYPVHLNRVSFRGSIPALLPGTNMKFFHADAAGVVSAADQVITFVPAPLNGFAGVDVDWTLPASGDFFIGALQQAGTVNFSHQGIIVFNTYNGITGMPNGGFTNYDSPTYLGIGSIEMDWRLEGALLLPPILNGSFETGTGSLGTLPVGSSAINNWTVTRGSIDWVDASTWASADGARSVDLQGLNSSGGVRQTVSTTIEHRYRLTFSLAGNPDGSPAVKHLRALADNTAADFAFDTTGHTHAAMGWVDRSLVFYASGPTTVIELYCTDPAGSWGPVIDNVRLVEAPCPADLGVQGGTPGHDNALDNNDFVVFINLFFQNDPRADFGRQGGLPGADAFFDNNDFVVFINDFFNGCP